MATDYTTNYNLDKYTANDKPNLRDQYNAAMDKIDAALLSANTNATEAKNKVDTFDAAIEAKADQTDLDALGALLPSSQFSSTNTVAQALSQKANTSALSSYATTQALQNEASARSTKDSQLETAINGKASTDYVLGQIKLTRHTLRHKRIVVIGDSLTFSTTGHATRYWWQYLSDYQGCTCYNFAIGGTGFTAGNKNFYQQLTDAANSNQFANDSITDVIIMGGLNDDQANLTSLDNAAGNCFDYALQTFPNAEIHAGFMLKGTSPLGSIHSVSPTQIPTLLNRARLSGITIIDAPWTWIQGSTSVDYGDGIHVNAMGQRYIMGYIASHLQGGSSLRIIPRQSFSLASSFAALCNESHANYSVNGYTFTVDIVFSLKNNTATNPFSTGNVDIANLPTYLYTSISSAYSIPMAPLLISQVTNESATPNFTVPPRAYLTNNYVRGQSMHYIRYTGTGGTLQDAHLHFNEIPFGI